MRHFHWVVATAGILLAAGCSTLQLNLPQVTEHSDGHHLPGKIIWHDLLTDTPEATERFYGSLFGWDFEPLPLDGANYTLIRHRGRLIGGMVDQNQLPARSDVSQWVVVMSVSDIERAVAAVGPAGGEVLTPPTSLGDRGKLAVVADSEGAVLALLQTRDGDPPDGSPLAATGSFLWDELWSQDPGDAGRFYGAVAGYSVQQRALGSGDQQVAYRVLSADGQPRAGMRERPAATIRPTWVSYLRVADAAELDGILPRVEALGGEVLVPSTERPAGGRVAVIAGPSGAGIALQTWGEDERLGALQEVGR